MYSTGIDIGGMTVKAGLVGGDGAIIKKLSAPTPLGSAERLADSVAGLIGQLSKDCAELCPRVGVTVPGTFTKEGVVTRLCNIGLDNIPLVELIKNRLPGFDMVLCNDADAAALAELTAGSLKGVQTGVAVTIGTGIGAGIILGRKLFTGGLKRGTELGHAVLAHGGAKCSCGNTGCAETICSATYLAAMAYKACKAGKGMIYSLHNEGREIDAKLLIDCAVAGDEYASEVFAGWLDSLSDLTASIVNVFDPEVIAIGGGGSAAGDILLEPLRKMTAEKCFFGSCGKIVAAELGNDAGILGAAAAAIQ